MYCFVDMHDNKLNTIKGIDGETCKKVLDACESLREILDFYFLGKCVGDALDELIQWSSTADRSGNYLMRNLHTAERLARDFLFEFRTCLDHMKTEIIKVYGKNSDLYGIYHDGTDQAYFKHKEYAFTYELRNYCQHCGEAVQGFNGTTGISSDKQTLLTNYNSWGDLSKNYISGFERDIDLLTSFSKAFKKFNEILIPVMQYLLNENDAGGKLMFVREVGDKLSKEFHHDVHSFHVITAIPGEDEGICENMGNNNGINAQPIDWSMIYGLSDLIRTKKVS